MRGLALGAEAWRDQLLAADAEEDRYRLLAHNMTDVITRHGRDGGVLFMSPAGEGLFGARLVDLHGHGLFDRVHVADRPAYLTALGDTAALAESRSAEFRVAARQRRHPWAFGDGIRWYRDALPAAEQAAADAGEEGRREVVAVLRDVTRRKQQQQALEDARAEAERANAAKSRFLATMARIAHAARMRIIGASPRC